MNYLTTMKITAYETAFYEAQNYFFDHEPPYKSVLGTWEGVTPFEIAYNAFVRLPLPAKAVFEQKPNYLKAEAYAGDVLEKVYYFYITNVSRKANNTIELSLRLDVLNTFKSEFIPAFSGKTIIKRQHENRYDLEGVTPSFSEVNIPKVIDKVSEGLQPKLYEKTGFNVSKNEFGNFYLIYKTNKELSAENLNNPVSCYLCADNEIPTAEIGSDIITWTGTTPPAVGYYYVFSNTFEVTTDIHGSRRTYKTSSGGLYYTKMAMLILHFDGNNLKVYGFRGDVFNDELKAYPVGSNNPLLDEINNFTDNAQNLVIFTTAGNVRYSPNILTYSATKAASFSIAFSSGVTSQPASVKFADLGRDDSRIMKIIKLPYAPKAITKISNHYEIEGFTYDENLRLFKLNDISSEFKTNIYSYDVTDVFEESVELDNAFSTDLRYLKDPKLYNSDFYNLKVNYDNFSAIIPFENCESLRPITPYKVNIVFKPTNTINSKFLFRLGIDGFYWQHAGIYENYLLAARNNEVTLFNNDYLNYLRNGYNYDKKTKAVQDTSSVVSTALAVGGGVAGIVGGVASSNPLAVAAGVATLAGSFTAGISSLINRETAFASKVANLQAQASSVTGVDDIDLFDEYGNNALRVSVWKPSIEIEKYLDDLFFYFGYARNYSGVPNLESRLHFNFLECEPAFNDISAFSDYIDEIKNKLNAGVTYFHLVSNGYDLAQQYENYEIGLIPA